MKRAPAAKSRSPAFTLVEVLIAIAIIVVVVALLFPAYRKVRKQSEETRCMSNLRNYGAGLLSFMNDNNGLPWWSGDGGVQVDGSITPNFEVWVRPYIHRDYDMRLRCPLATPKVRREVRNRFNYGGNGALCIYYPKLKNIPVGPSRVALAAETYSPEGFNHTVHLNMTIWGIGETPAYGAVETFAPIENRTLAQYHGPEGNRGLHFFFADGHAQLVIPSNNDWRAEPVYGTATNGGLFYSRDQLKTMRAYPERY